jgi:hypothetical protein
MTMATNIITGDPTIEEMRKTLKSIPFADEHDELDREAAIYWFASEYHGGQGSTLYSALCASPYTPGRLTRDISNEGDGAQYCYGNLVREYVGDGA